MKPVDLDYGTRKMAVELPDSAVVVRYGETYQDPPKVDPVAATRTALDAPLEMPPLTELAGPGKTAVIVFPDRVKGGAHPLAHRRVSIPMIVEDLLAGGCRLEDITLLCAQGLHRRNTYEEWLWYLGPEIVHNFWPNRIVNHDAEAPDLANLGHDDMGNAVQTSRLVLEADIPILVGHCAANPYGGYSGGYKMLVTGMAGRRSIASHHTPKTMLRKDWLGGGTGSHMRDQFQSIGEAIEDRTGKQFFTVDAVLGQFGDVLDVKAGRIAAVEKATWPLASRRADIALDELAEPADVLLMGLPRDFHYGPGMGTNPILMSLGIGAQYSRCSNALSSDSVVIAAAWCDGWFNDEWFPSYEETYESLQNFDTAEAFLASDEAHRISTDNDYCFRYSHGYSYHPFHAMSMTAGGAVPLKWCSQVYVVGAQKPGYARGMGFRTAPTVEAALKDAQRYVGKDPRILCTPESFSGGMAVNVSVGDQS
jgi:nickel-dependent lactate racemase